MVWHRATVFPCFFGRSRQKRAGCRGCCRVRSNDASDGGNWGWRVPADSVRVARSCRNEVRSVRQTPVLPDPGYRQAGGRQGGGPVAVAAGRRAVRVHDGKPAGQRAAVCDLDGPGAGCGHADDQPAAGVAGAADGLRGQVPDVTLRRILRHRGGRTREAGVARTPLPQDAGDGSVVCLARAHGRRGAVRGRGHRPDPELLRTVPAAAVLCGAGARHAVRGADAGEHSRSRGAAGVRPADRAGGGRGGDERRPRVQAVLGQIHGYGRRVPGQYAGIGDVEGVRRRRSCRRRYGREGRGVPPDDDAGAADSVALADRHGRRGLRRHRGRYRRGGLAVPRRRRGPGGGDDCGVPLRQLLPAVAPAGIVFPCGDERHDLHQADLRAARRPRAGARRCRPARRRS